VRAARLAEGYEDQAIRLRAVAARFAARREAIADEATATKWVAALSTGALFAVGQLLRRPGTSDLLGLRDATGLVIGAAGFAVSIIGAGLFLFQADLRSSRLQYRVTSRAIEIAERVRRIRRALLHMNDAKPDSPEEQKAAEELRSALKGFAAKSNLAASAGILLDRTRTAEALSVRINVGGFVVGLAAVVGDFVAKMPG